MADRAQTGQPTRRFQLTPTITGQAFPRPGVGPLRVSVYTEAGANTVNLIWQQRSGTFAVLTAAAVSGVVADRIIWPLDFDLNINIAAGVGCLGIVVVEEG